MLSSDLGPGIAKADAQLGGLEDSSKDLGDKVDGQTSRMGDAFNDLGTGIGADVGMGVGNAEQRLKDLDDAGKDATKDLEGPRPGWARCSSRRASRSVTGAFLFRRVCRKPGPRWTRRRPKARASLVLCQTSARSPPWRVPPALSPSVPPRSRCRWTTSPLSIRWRPAAT